MKPKQIIDDPAAETLAKLARVAAATPKKPKPSEVDAAGLEFKRLLAADSSANASLKDIRAAKATRKNQLKAALTVVWDALGKGVTVNGYSSREDWAKKFAGYSRRQCEYIVYGRPDRTGESANHGAQGFKLTQLDFYFYNRRKEEKSVAMMVDFEVAGSRDSGVVKLSVRVPGENVHENYDAAVKKMTALLKQLRLWNGETAKTIKEGVEEYFADVEIKPTPAPKAKKPVAKLNKKERLAYDALKKKLDPLAKHFEDGQIGAVEWRSMVTIFENASIGRAIFRKRSGRFADFMKQVRERMEAAIRDAQQITVVLKDNCEEHTGQHENCKECMRRHIPTDAERAQSELFNATGNLDGDEEQL